MKMKNQSEIVTLCREWLYQAARLKADAIMVGEFDDEEMDRLSSTTMAAQEALVEKMLEIEPETLADARAILDVIEVALDNDATIDPDHVKLFKLAQRTIARADQS